MDGKNLSSPPLLLPVLSSIQFGAPSLFLLFFHFSTGSTPTFSFFFSASFFSLFQRLLFLSFSTPPFSFFFNASFFFLFQCLTSSFLQMCCPFFEPQNIFFSPKQSLFNPKPFSVQPTPLFQPLFVLFQPLFFLFHVLPSKSPQTCSTLFVHASFSVSCQLLRPKKLFLQFCSSKI